MCPRLRDGVKWQSRVMPRRVASFRIDAIISVTIYTFFDDTKLLFSAEAMLVVPNTSTQDSTWLS